MVLPSPSSILTAWDRLRAGPRVIVHRVKEHHRSPESWDVEFEVENIGGRATSLYPEIEVRGLEWGKPFALRLKLIDSGDRQLELHRQMCFTARQDEGYDLFTSDNRRYRIRLTRGRDPVVYLPKVDQRCGAGQYWRGYFRERLDAYQYSRFFTRLLRDWNRSQGTEINDPRSDGTIRSGRGQRDSKGVSNLRKLFNRIGG